MTLKNFLSICIVSSGLLITAGCSNDATQYQLPENIELTRGNLVNPIYISNILGNPNRSEFIWSDSLLRLCKVKNITISKMNDKHPEKVDKELCYSIDKNGHLKKYKYFEYDKSSEPYSKSSFYYSESNDLDSVDIQKFFGIKSKNVLRVKRVGNTVTYLYEKGLGKYDQIVYYYDKKKSLEMIVEKVGDVITSIDFIVPENTPMSKLKKMVKKATTNNTEVELAEKNVFYIKNGSPTSAYSINVDWAQQDLIQEWTYDDSGNLLIFKEFVNKSIIKEIELTYSTDNVLRSFLYNKELYSLAYN